MRAHNAKLDASHGPSEGHLTAELCKLSSAESEGAQQEHKRSTDWLPDVLYCAFLPQHIVRTSENVH